MSNSRVLNVGGYGLTLADLPPQEQGRIDPRTWFADSRESFEIEIGSGKGTFLVQQSTLQPTTSFLGIEWAGEFFRYAADRVRRHGLSNVRLLHADAVEFFRHRCVGGVASVIHLYFSDPWPKKRHHKRRVIQDQSLIEFHRVLSERGEVRLVTDHDDLWAWCEDHVARNQHLFSRQPFEPPPSAGEGEVVGSNFERKYRREGRPFHAMTLKKRPL